MQKICGDAQNKEKKKEFVFLAWVFLAAFAVRISWFYLRLKFSPFFLGAWNDDFCYNDVAQNIIGGGGMMLGDGLRAYLPPVYPLFLSLVYLVFNDPYFAIWVQTALSSLSCVLAYLLAKEIFSRKEGVLAACLSAISPLYIMYNSWLLTESLYIFILTLALLCIVGFQKSRNEGCVFGSGFLLGIATLTRPQTVFFILLLFIWFVVTKMGRREFIKSAAIFIFGLLIVLSPWIVRNYLVLGEFVPFTTHGGITFYHGNNPKVLEPEHFGEQISNSTIPDRRFWDLPEVERDRTYGKMGMRFIMGHLSDLPKLITYRWYYVFSPIVPQFGTLKSIFYFAYWIFITPFSVLGLYISLKKKKALAYPLALLILGGVFMITFYAGYFRLRESLESALIIFAAHFWSEILSERTGKLCPGKGC